MSSQLVVKEYRTMQLLNNYIELIMVELYVAINKLTHFYPFLNAMNVLKIKSLCQMLSIKLGIANCNKRLLLCTQHFIKHH